VRMFPVACIVLDSNSKPRTSFGINIWTCTSSIFTTKIQHNISGTESYPSSGKRGRKHRPRGYRSTKLFYTYRPRGLEQLFNGDQLIDFFIFFFLLRSDCSCTRQPVLKFSFKKGKKNSAQRLKSLKCDRTESCLCHVPWP
jgi:hypothetical protein